jgi:hypothetical protein
LFLQTYADIIRVKSSVEGSGPSVTDEELVDVIHLLKVLAEQADTIRKEAERLKGTTERVVCMRWVTNPNATEIIRGKVASGSPYVSQRAAIPHPTNEPEAYQAMMKAFKVPDDVVQTGLLDLHWKRFQEYVTRLTAEGKPLPAGVDPNRTTPVFKVATRALRSVDTAALDIEGGK